MRRARSLSFLLVAFYRSIWIISLLLGLQKRVNSVSCGQSELSGLWSRQLEKEKSASFIWAMQQSKIPLTFTWSHRSDKILVAHFVALSSLHSQPLFLPAFLPPSSIPPGRLIWLCPFFCPAFFRSVLYALILHYVSVASKVKRKSF